MYVNDSSKESTTVALIFVPIVLVILILCAVFCAALFSPFRRFKSRLVGVFIRKGQQPQPDQPQLAELPREQRSIRLSDDSYGLEKDQEAALTVSVGSIQIPGFLRICADCHQLKCCIQRTSLELLLSTSTRARSTSPSAPNDLRRLDQALISAGRPPTKRLTRRTFTADQPVLWIIQASHLQLQNIPCKDDCPERRESLPKCLEDYDAQRVSEASLGLQQASTDQSHRLSVLRLPT